MSSFASRDAGFSDRTPPPDPNEVEKVVFTREGKVANIVHTAVHHYTPEGGRSAFIAMAIKVNPLLTREILIALVIEEAKEKTARLMDEYAA